MAEFQRQTTYHNHVAIQVVWLMKFLVEEELLKILVTAFEPYDQWRSNSSWEALTEFLREHGLPTGVTTRRYPVDFDRLNDKLSKDLERGFDFVLHLGQSPGACAVHLEAIAINVAGVTYAPGKLFGPIVEDAPVAYRTRCPLNKMCSELLESGIPASISYHAGTYLCNAAMYLSHHWHAVRNLDCHIGFAHMPLTLEQSVASGRDLPGLPVKDLARAVHCMLGVLRGTASESPPTVLA
jgi:pyroglutamyl-peptidase